MNVSTDPLIQRFLALCCFDERLRQAIVSFEVASHPDGLLGQIQLGAQEQTEWLWQFMPQIAQTCLRLGDFKAIEIQTANKLVRLKMADLLDTFPEAGSGAVPIS